MNKKNILKIIIIFIAIISIFMVLVVIFYPSKYNLDFTKSSLTYYINKYSNNTEYTPELLKTSNGKILGTVFDTSSQNAILKTVGIFEFDLDNEQFEFFKYDDGKRIFDFLVINNSIYYVEIQEDDETFYWSFIKTDKNFDNKEILSNGMIKNVFNYPRILTTEDGKILLISITDDENGEEKFQFTTYFQGQETILMEDKGSTLADTGVLLYNIANVYIYKNKIVYTVVDENKIQHLNTFDIEKSIIKNQYTNFNSTTIMYNYKFLSNGLYIQLILKDNENTSQILYINEKNTMKFSGATNTFDNLLNESILLFHNNGDKWKAFFSSKKKIYNIKANVSNIYPKYLISENKVIIQDFKNNFYVGKLDYIEDSY